METFAPPRPLTDYPGFEAERSRSLARLEPGALDAPIRELVLDFARLPQCFTLQSCYGHFVHAEQPDRASLEPLPGHDIGQVTYRIAYLALCIEDSRAGRRLLRALEDVPAVDSELIQLGSPTWFWDRHPNSYALQVEPARYAHRDVAMIPYREALTIEMVRGRFFSSLGTVVHRVLLEDLPR
jgi:hypothetical protein